MADNSKIKKIKTFFDNPEYGLFKELDQVNEKLNEVTDKLQGVDLSSLEEIKGDRGDKGEKGNKGDKGESIIGPKGEIGPQGSVGSQGRPGVDGKNGKDGRNGTDGFPDKPEKIKEKLESLKGNERLDVSAVKNALTLDDVVKGVKGKLEPKDIKGMPLNFNDMRWHGGGITQDAADLRYLELNGGNSPSADINWGNNKIINVSTPISAQDVATKYYVDSSILVENLWDRTGNTLIPHNTNDSVTLNNALVVASDQGIGLAGPSGNAGINYVTGNNYVFIVGENASSTIALSSNGTWHAILNTISLTGDQTFTFPDNSGTFALISNLTSEYVPYTGANANVKLGTFKLQTPVIFPASDSTTAIQFNKANGTTNVLNIDTTNGYVGIGKTNPAEVLDVVGNVAIGSFYTSHVSIGYAASNLMCGRSTEVLALGANSTEYARILTTGEIGIHTTTPTYLLSIEPPSNANATLGLKTSGGAASTIYFGRSGSYNAKIYYNRTITDMFEFSTASNDKALTIGVDGRIGIGITNQSSYLHLPAGIATAGYSPLKFTSGTNLTTAETGAIEYNGTNLFFTRAGTVRENVLIAIDNVTAPSTNITPVMTSYYGGNTNQLGDPNRWLSVNILGATYKIPLYT